MKTITIYGASDDLIEIEGDEIHDEFYVNSDEKTAYIATSDGTLMSIEYGKRGMWYIKRLQAGTAKFEKKEATDPNGDYSDRVTLTGDISWVLYGNDVARPTKAKTKAAYNQIQRAEGSSGMPG